MTNYTVGSGQTVSGITLGRGDSLVVSTGGAAQSITLNGGPYMGILTPISSLALFEADLTTQVSGLNVVTGSAQFAGVATNTTVGPAGLLYVEHFATVNGLVVSAGATVDYDNSVPTTGLTLLANAALDFNFLPYSPSVAVSLNPAGTVLTLSGGGITIPLGVTGDYSRDTFVLSSDNSTFLGDQFPPGTIVTAQAFVVPINSTSSMVLGSGHVVALNAGESLVTSAGGNTLNVISTGTVVSNGPDTIRGGTGATAVSTVGSGATVVGGAGALVDRGGPGNNLVFAGTGGLTYMGGSGFDMVVGQGNPAAITGGTGGGEFFGGGNAIITAGAGGAINVEIGGNGDQLFAAGPNGVLFGTSGGSMSMSSANDTGSSVFFGAGGSGRMTFITGAGNDILALGQGTNTVTLGSGHDTIFGNGGSTSVSNITAGSGSLDLAFSGASTVLNIAAGAARAFNLFAYMAGADTVHLSGYTATQAADALASQRNVGLGAQLTFGDNSTVLLVGVQRATAGLFS